MSQKIVCQTNGEDGPSDTQRSHRIAICRASDELRRVVNHMDIPPSLKGEAHNLISMTQRMLCAFDGSPMSHDTLNPF